MKGKETKKQGKKLLTIVATFILVIVNAFVLTACGNDSEKKDKGETPDTPAKIEKVVDVGSYTALKTAISGDADVVKLTDNILVEDAVTVNRAITFDLNNHTLSVPSTHKITVADNLEVSFKNGTVVSNSGSFVYDSEKTTLKYSNDVVKKCGVVSANELTTAIADENVAEAVLLESIDYAGHFEVSKKITLDLNGKTVKGNGDCGVFYVLENGDLTITGNGNVIAVASSNESGRGDTNTSHTVYAMAVWAYGGNVTIENGHFSNETVEGQTIGAGNSESNTQTKDNLDLIYAKDNNGKTSSIVIKGGTFKCVQTMWTLNIQNASSSTIKVEGGNFIGYDPSVGDNGMDDSKANKVLLADGYKTIYDQETTTYKVVKKDVNE